MRKKWSDEDVSFLKANMYYKTVKELSVLLNRSVGSIYSKRAQLNGIAKEWERRSKKDVSFSTGVIADFLKEE